jgi:alpha-tubulin suppressor-like RCC1 family protein
VHDLPPAVRIFAGGANTCAQLAAGGLLCWGANESGQLGPGSRDARPVPAPIPGTASLVSIGFGNNSYAGSRNPDLSKINSFACGLTGHGTVLCWGSNYTGQVGDGTREDRPHPTEVVGVTGAIDLELGNVHACALTRSGRVWCWGRNEFGNLGDGTMGPSNVRPQPALVPGIDDAVGLALGDAHSCARRRQGEIACWGVNNYGQLGDGTLMLRPSPITVSGFP